MFGALVAFGGLFLCQADHATAAGPLPMEVRRLVRQLDAPRLADRNTAEQKLIGLGPGVLEHLPGVSESVSAETRQRLDRIRQVLQQELAREAAAASTVTLRGQALPLGEILAAIQQQTANPIAGAGELKQMGIDPKLEIDFDQTPFWEAIDQVLDRANLAVYSFGQPKALTVRPRGPGQPGRCGRACYGGPFRFEPTSVEARRDLRDLAQQSLHVVLEVTWEPRLAPIVLQLPLKQVEALDDSGGRITVENREAEWEVPVSPDAMAKELRIPLALPPRSVQKIARLKGTLTALLPGKIETFRFADLSGAGPLQQRIAGVTVAVEGTRKSSKGHEIRLRVRFDQANEALQSHRNWIFDNEAYLEGPDGKRIAWGSYETTRQTDNELGIAYLFPVQEPLAGYTMVYKTPGLILSAAIPFEVKDLPLP